MDDILRTEQLTKVYGTQKVVDSVSISVTKGDIYGFVGKNGAGKTTFIRMILGLTQPTDGSFSLFSGMEVSAARKKIGSLVESPALYSNMSALENLQMCCTILGENKRQAEEILQTIGLTDTGKKKAGNFSLGMKQRLGIGMALVGDPDFLILDEPINGLDPTGIVEIRELLLSLKNERGKTIFVSSHYLGELEKIATRYGIIAKGKLVEEITSEELSAKCGVQTILKTDKPEKAVLLLKQLLHTEKIELSKDGAIIILEPIDNIGKITNELFTNDITVGGITTSDSNAEKYFIDRMEGNA